MGVCICVFLGQKSIAEVQDSTSGSQLSGFQPPGATEPRLELTKAGSLWPEERCAVENRVSTALWGRSE